MKKKWLVSIGMVVALITGLLTPSVAVAAKHEAFEGFGVAYIAGPYDHWQTGPVEHAVDEPVNCGDLTVIGWDDVNGSSLESLHAGVIVLHRDGEMRGSLHGTFTLKKGDSMLEGNMRGKVTFDPVTNSIHDQGTFTATGGTGIFAKVRAQGNWEVFLEWDESIETYVGWITIEGTHH